jgi:hypothetical protein
MFDAHGAVTFDLSRGLVRLRGESPQVLIPAELLVAACEGGAANQLGSRLGAFLAARLRKRLGDTVEQPHDVVIEQLAGELALAGLGALRLERWGAAVVFVLGACPLGPYSGDFVEAMLAAALVEIGQRELAVVSLGQSGVERRYAMLAPPVATQLRRKLEVGESWQALLAGLKRGGASHAG